MKQVLVSIILLSGLVQAGETEKIHLAIIGSGPAGHTAALYAARANIVPHVFMGDEPNGQLTKTHSIKNWPGVEESTGTELMKFMDSHTSSVEYGIIKHQEAIIEVAFNQHPFVLKTDSEKSYQADAVIIATGAKPRRLQLESEKKYWGRGVTSCAVCDGMFAKNKDVVVVGGGSSAIEDAIYLSGLASKVHLVHRGGVETLKAEEILQKQLFQLIDQGKVIPHWNQEIAEIYGDTNGMTGVVLKENQKIDAYMVFIAIGYLPNTALFKDKLDMANGNYLKVKSGVVGNATQTSVPGVFAAGDVIDPVYQQAITSAASGAMAALDSKQYLMKQTS